MTDSLINVMALSDDNLSAMWRDRNVYVNEASTLHQIATLISVGVAFFARQQKYAPVSDFHPEAREEAWISYAQTIVSTVTGCILDVNAPLWVGEMIRSMLFRELEAQTREWHTQSTIRREAELRAAFESLRKAGTQ